MIWQWVDRRWRWLTDEYMTLPMYGYALAMRCWLREEAMPKWKKHLRSGVRSEFKQAFKFLHESQSTG